jgi:hypothetical protein
VSGEFDLVFALAVLQREPLSVMDATDLSKRYSYARFDEGVRLLFAHLRAGGLLCVIHSHYRIEDSSVSGSLEPIDTSMMVRHTYFGRDGRKLSNATSRTVFKKI